MPGSVVGAASNRVPTIIATGFSPGRDFPFGIAGYTGDNGSRSIGTSLWLRLPGVFRGRFDRRLLLGRHTMTRSQALVLWTISIVGLIAASIIPSLSPPSAHHLDLLIHFGVYVVLAALPAALLERLRVVIALGVLLAGVGLVIEMAQSYVPGRSSSELDLIANCLGILLGLAVGRLLRRYIGLRAL